MHLYIGIFILLPLVHTISFDENMKSFSYAHKAATCFAGKENVLYEHYTGPGVITEQWHAGAGCFNQHTILRYYFDGDKKPAIEGNMYMMHGMGVFTNESYPQNGPWGTKWIGLTAHGGGLYNTFRMPYQKSFRVTLISNTTSFFWYIIRGVENYPIIIGDLKLPSTAKLVLQKIDDVTYPPFSYIKLADSRKSGMLLMTTLAGESSNYGYLEGCFRLLVDNNTNIQYLSSGTEDFFLSAYYYNDGIYHTDHSGLTVFKKPGMMSAYKFFVADPIIFQSSMSLIWRVGEKRDNNCYNGSPEKCFNDGESVQCTAPNEYVYDVNDLQLFDTKISAYVWFYEW